MIYNNYPDDYIVINAKWVEWDNDEQRWCFMTEDAFEKAQSLADYTKQVRKELCDGLALPLIKHFQKDAEFTVEEICKWIEEYKDQIEQGKQND